MGPEKYQAALAKPHARLFDITGRAMRGWVMVDPPGYADDDALAEWVQMSLDFVNQLPSK